MSEPTDIPDIPEIRKLGTRALATYVRDVLVNRTGEVDLELGHLERAALHANLDRWLERQRNANSTMAANNDDMSPRGRIAFWTARAEFDRATVEVDRAWRRLHDPAPPEAAPTSTADSPSPASKRPPPNKEKK